MPPFQPKPIPGARALLFDRLTSAQEAPQGLRVYDLAALRDSVRRELDNLLNTRCPCSVAELQGVERTVVNYGIPDFGHMSAASGTDMQQLAMQIEQAIAAYEPRLRQVRVKIQPAQGAIGATGSIQAVLAVQSVLEPVSFPISLSSGMVELQTEAVAGEENKAKPEERMDLMESKIDPGTKMPPTKRQPPAGKAEKRETHD